MLVAVVAVGAGLAGAQPVAAAEICVGGPGPGCLASIQDAVDAAGEGDTIRIGPGTYAGGITIAKSVSLVGAGAGVTRVVGGGPVITIGELGGGPGLAVSIGRVTISGGLNDSKPDSFFAAGGGVLIAGGATATISDSVVSGNRVTPRTPLVLCTTPGGLPVLCAFASGGGVANFGSLLLVRSRVEDNVAGATPTSASAASDARGGGLWNAGAGTMTIRETQVRGNRSAVSPPVGRFAEGGGIGDDGTLAIEDSVVSGNTADARADVPSSFPFDITTEAVGGGIRITDAPPANATITNTAVTDNSVSSYNTGGDAGATSGGIDVDGPLLLVDSTVDRNRVSAIVPPESGFLAGAVFGGIEVSDVATIRSSSISHNVNDAVSATGPANVAGVGVANLSGRVTLERARVIGNVGTARGIGGLALGGGILNVDFGGGAPELAISGSVVTANALTAATGVVPRGGGIFSADVFTLDPVPFTLERTVIHGNGPDQCVGC